MNTFSQGGAPGVKPTLKLPSCFLRPPQLGPARPLQQLDHNRPAGDLFPACTGAEPEQQQGDCSRIVEF